MFPLVTNTSAVSLVKIIITEKKCKTYYTLILLSTRTQHIILAVSDPLLPSKCLLQELTGWLLGKKVLTTASQHCHCYWHFLQPFNVTNFNLGTQIYLRFKAHFSSTEANFHTWTAACNCSRNTSVFSTKHTRAHTHTPSYLHRAP